MSESTEITMAKLLFRASDGLLPLADVLRLLVKHELDTLEALDATCTPADDDGIIAQAMLRAGLEAVRKIHEDRGITHG